MICLLAILGFVLPAGDGAVVMLHGVPAEPWAALSPQQLEQMWTYGIDGYQVTRSAWSGYILRGPSGTGSVLADLAETLAGEVTVPDSSLWARTLQLAWEADAGPVWFLSGRDIDTSVPVPSRNSRWLSAGADTLILSLPVANTVMMWTGGYQGEFFSAAWRGVGTEVIPAGEGHVEALLSSVMDGSPGDLISLEYSAHSLDGYWADTWSPLLEAADSLVALGSQPAVQNTVLWVRGSIGERLDPWVFIGPPPPPAVAAHIVEPLEGVTPLWGRPPLTDLTVLEMPGTLSDPVLAAFTAGVLERMIARMVLDSHSSCRAYHTPDGRVELVFAGVEHSGEDLLAMITDALTPIIFTAPEDALINNAAVRAGIAPPDQRTAVEAVAVITGFL